MRYLNDILGIWEQEVWGNSLLHWLAAALAALAIYLILRLIKGGLTRRLDDRVAAGAGGWLQSLHCLLRQTQGWFLLVVALLYGGYLFLDLSGRWLWAVKLAGVVALWGQAALWTNALVGLAVRRYADKHKEADPATVTTVSALGALGKAAVWVLAALLAAVNMKIEITPLIAGLGIGGIAVALAAQNILGDLFASVSIVLDKPFVLGDFIIVDDKMGNVEYIGLKTTRLHSLSGEQLVFSNADLLKSRIHNYKRMCERRALFSIGVTYETPYEKLAAIPAMLREVIESQQPVRFGRAHFARYGDSALVFEVVYHVLSADYNTYMDVQQAVNLAIFRRFAAEHIDFAYPTRTVYLRQPPIQGQASFCGQEAQP